MSSEDDTGPSPVIFLKYSASLGVDILIPPGNFEHFKFAAEHIDEVLEHPLTQEDRTLLEERLPLAAGHPFYDPECWDLSRMTGNGPVSSTDDKGHSL